MVRTTAKIANADLLAGDKLYQQRARKILPYIVRQAKAGIPIYYSDLAKEASILNPRNLNYPLGTIGRALKELSKKTNIEIPQIQCVVVNKKDNFPGDGIGWFISKEDFSSLSRGQKRQVVDKVLAEVYAFPRWDWVLQKFNLEPLQTDLTIEIKKAKKITGNGGESPFHLDFKNYIAGNPQSIGLPSSFGHGETEYKLPTSDTVDILFGKNNALIAVEVKSRISPSEDILRGLFQCVKYRHLIEAEQIVEGNKTDCRVILALEGIFPSHLVAVKNILGIEVVDNVTIRN
jgi:hypothetical protein